MKNLTQLLLIALIAMLPVSVMADKKEKDDTPYLVGAVPEVNGKVVFSREYQLPGTLKENIYERAKQWMEKRLAANGNEQSRIVYTNPEEGTIAGMGAEWIVFKSKLLTLDRTWMEYQLTMLCEDNKFTLRFEKIRYTYRETEKYIAEEWITDKYALRKNNTKLVPALAKWRRKTVDFANALFEDAGKTFGIQAAKPAANENGSSVIGAATDNPIYAEVALTQIPGDVYALMANSKIVIVIGKDADNQTTVTANAGGAIGFQAGKAVAYSTLSADQPYEAVEKAETYTLKIYAKGEDVPAVIIDCKKLPAQPVREGQPRTYVGEIVKMSIRK